ncbi:MAG: hypothetical protein FJX72_07125 [Armatimonadetes bacterium]|nr:hypothetical protein [Armatimonadota bacterium]
MTTLVAIAALLPVPKPGMTTIATAVVDPSVTGYATFQSHNQKIVANRNGILLAYVKTRNEAYTAQNWRLVRSLDGGRTFDTVYEATHATNPPVLETDRSGNLFLGRVDFTSGDAFVYRFDASSGYSNPSVTRIPLGAAGKYCMLLDERRNALYWFAHNGTFARLNLASQDLKTTALLKDGPDAALQYPSLSLAGDGTIHAAWTTVRHGKYLYWDIHHMLSPDGGLTWRTPSGDALIPPIVADQHGPTPRISLDDEFDSHTWLAGFMAKDARLHFLYLAQTTPPRQHYVRCDARTGRKELDTQPELRGREISLSGLDGFFAARALLPNSPLYCVMPWQGRIACLASDDNGTTWYDYAVSEGAFKPYAVGGCREITPDGDVIGAFTDTTGAFAGQDNALVFLRFRAGLSSAEVISMRHARGVATIRFGAHRGQPAQVRVRGADGRWSAWARFAAEAQIAVASRPTHGQLKSRLGIVSEPFALSQEVGRR